MRIPLFAALVAATALIPAAAIAQDRHGHGDRNGGAARSESHVADRGGGHNPGLSHSAGSARPSFTARPVAARPQFQPSDRHGANPGATRGRFDGGGARPHAIAARPVAGDNAWHAQAGGRHGDNRVAVHRGGQNARDYGHARGRYDNHQAFSRNWRGDRRYDWRNYRTRNRNAYHLPRYYAPRDWGYGYRRFNIGFTLSSVLFGENYWISDPYAYRLPPAYGPYRWVRYYNDALLVDIRTGYVVDTVYDIFW